MPLSVSVIVAPAATPVVRPLSNWASLTSLAFRTLSWPSFPTVRVGCSGGTDGSSLLWSFFPVPVAMATPAPSARPARMAAMAPLDKS
ncbi:hypothetical protein D3C80_1626410 [compost metagenome]